MPATKRSAERPVQSVAMVFVGFAIWASTAHATEFCVRDPQVQAVDSSVPATQSFLDRMKAIGVNTIIRYYDHEDETLPGKTLRRAERDAIVMNGLKMGVVFQHRNNQFASFTALRGRQDAERSLTLAAENSQPRGSAIYFGVDGPWRMSYELTNVVAYFRELKASLAGLGYRIGVYGSGLVCDVLQTAGLAELCWLAAPTAWPDYHTYYQTRKWGLAQLRTSQCGGRSVDFDLVNDMVADYGQFA